MRPVVTLKFDNTKMERGSTHKCFETNQTTTQIETDYDDSRISCETQNSQMKEEKMGTPGNPKGEGSPR